MKSLIITAVSFLMAASTIQAQHIPPVAIQDYVLQEDHADSLPTKMLNSVARVYNSSARAYGSATCIARLKDGRLVFLTNHHVAGNTGNKVTITPFAGGRQRPSIKGRVIWHKHSGYRDAALVLTEGPDETVYVATLGVGYIPEKDDAIIAYGCSSARQPRMRLGRVLSVTSETFSYSGGAVSYPGDSGSSVWSWDGSTVIGLVTWNDGKSKPDWGKCQKISGVYRDIQNTLQSEHEELLELFDVNSDRRWFNKPKEELGLLERIFGNLNRLESEAIWRLEEIKIQQVGILDRIRANRLKYEREMMELREEQMLRELQLREQYGKQYEELQKDMEEEVRGIRGMFQKIWSFLEWVFMIACVIGGFWFMNTLFGPGWLGSAFGAIIRTVRGTFKGIADALKK